LLLAGCGRTLVFGERDGVNMAIRADAKTQPPVEVNFGLNRTVGTIVPPAGEMNGRPAGEAISMVAGFQIERPTDIDLTKPLAAHLWISTQFASGDAASTVAGNPTIVQQIVTLNGPSRPISRTPAALCLQELILQGSEAAKAANEDAIRKQMTALGVPRMSVNAFAFTGEAAQQEQIARNLGCKF
jgi:hypothetical protein